MHKSNFVACPSDGAEYTLPGAKRTVVFALLAGSQGLRETRGIRCLKAHTDVSIHPSRFIFLSRRVVERFFA